MRRSSVRWPSLRTAQRKDTVSASTPSRRHPEGLPEPLSSAHLLLRYQALVDRERVLRESIAATESRLESDPAVVSRQEDLAAARANQDSFAVRLRESDSARE